MTLKKHRFWIALAISLFLYSCIDDPGIENDTGFPVKENELLTVDEARAYFEEHFTYETRSDHNRFSFLPEDFTPEWNKASQGENGRVTRVDVPILSNTRLRALRSEYVDCGAHPYTVDVPVKLVLLRGLRSEDSPSQYLMLLIPERAYYANHKNRMEEVVPESEDSKNYCGYALYYQLNSRRLSYISKYSDGRIVEHFGLTNKQEGYAERIQRMRAILSQIRLTKASCVQTRMGGEIDEVIIYGCGSCCSDPCICDILNSCSNCGCNPCQCHDTNICPSCYSDPCRCHNDNRCPYCGSDSCGNSCTASGSGNNNNSSSEDNNDDNDQPPFDNEEDTPKSTPESTKNKLKTILTSPKMQSVIAKRGVPFVQSSQTKTLTASIESCNGKVTGVKIKYNSTYFSGLGEAGKQLVLFHEYVHIFLAYQNMPYKNEHLVNDPEYLQGIKDIFPGESDDFYDKMRYAGCSNTVAFQSLSPQEQDEVKELVRMNLKK